jgi:dsRNA-specific ribonuclease
MLTAKEIELLTQEFSIKLDYKFEKPELLVQALTRESALGLHVPKDAPYFETLEFLGDRSYKNNATPG